MLDLFETANQDAAANAVANPARTLETTAGDAFRTTWDANMRYRSLGAMARNTSDAAQDWLDAHEKLTGQKLENPYEAGGGFLTFDYQKYTDARRKVEEATQQWAIERGDPAYAFPDDQTLFRQGVKKGQAALQRAAEAGQGQQGFGSTLASLGAGLAAPFGDPADAMLNGVAMATIPVGGGMLSSALMAGTAFAGLEAASGLVNLPYQRQIDPTRGLGNVALESLEAAAGGAVLDLGGHAVGALWRRYMRKAPEVAAALPTPVRDAAIVAERAADLDAQNPFKGLQGEAAFNEAVPAVERALVNGDPVVLPEAAAQAAQARTGQVHVPEEPLNEIARSPVPFLGHVAAKLGGIAKSARDAIFGLDDGITVFHGSPHAFVQPQSHAIGSGEGNQAFGFGLYGAQRRGVANWYRETYSPEGGGHLYQMRISAPENRFFDWDRPIAEQPPEVRAALKSAGFVEGDEAHLKDALQSGETGPALAKELGDAGVAGVRYLDAVSRKHGDGTRNFVVFNEKDIHVTHRDDEPILDIALRESGLDPGMVGENVRSRVLSIMGKDKVTHPLDAYQRAIKEMTDEFEARAVKDREIGAHDGRTTPPESGPVGTVAAARSTEVSRASSASGENYGQSPELGRAFVGSRAVDVRYELAEARGLIRYYHGTASKDATGFEGKTFLSPSFEYARDYRGGPNNVLYTDFTKEEAIKRGLYDEINGFPIIGSIDDGAALLKPYQAQSEAATPQKMNRKARRADKQPAQEPTMAASAQAAEGRAFVGSRAVDVRYELAELGDLVGSHDRDFRVNPDYPAELQPRDRGGKAARDQVYDMAAKLEPERLGPSPEANSGAPIVGPDNVIESGNGRTMAIRAAYDMDGERAAAYRAWLERNGYETTGMKQPVLVARRTSPMSEAERADFAHAANGSASLRMNAVEQALSDARHISGDLVDLLQRGMVDSAANRDFIRSLVAKMPAGERGGMVTATGQLSQSGVKRVQAALVARAYGDPGVVARAFDHAEPNIKTIAAALVEAAPEWIKMREAVARGEVAAGHDITDAVMTAVKTIMRARDEGEPVSRALAQGDFFASDTSGLAARLFFKDGSLTRFLSKKDMGDNLQTFAQAILEQRGKGEDLFGSPPPDTRQVLGNVTKLSDARQAQIAEALKPEVIEKAFGDPKVHEAAEAELRRSIEQGRNRVPVEDADGNVTMGFADVELKRIDDELAAAQEIKSCTTVQTEAAE